MLPSGGECAPGPLWSITGRLDTASAKCYRRVSRPVPSHSVVVLKGTARWHIPCILLFFSPQWRSCLLSAKRIETRGRREDATAGREEKRRRVYESPYADETIGPSPLSGSLVLTDGRWQCTASSPSTHIQHLPWQRERTAQRNDQCQVKTERELKSRRIVVS